MPSAKAQFRFGDFLVDQGRGWLRQGDREIDLPPRAFQVLGYLIEHRDRLVPKQELIEALWKDTFVTDDALVQAVTALRRALGDDADEPRYIRTKARVGYQFIAPVEALAAAGGVAVTLAPVRRGPARALLLLIQVGYLTLYGIALWYTEEAVRVLTGVLSRFPAAGALSFSLVVFLALGGIAVRLYLITSLAFDHPQTGKQFQRLFPGLFFLDLIWSLSPFLVAENTGLVLPLALVPLMAYAPFAQRTLVRTAYAP